MLEWKGFTGFMRCLEVAFFEARIRLQDVCGGSAKAVPGDGVSTLGDAVSTPLTPGAMSFAARGLVCFGQVKP